MFAVRPMFASSSVLYTNPLPGGSVSNLEVDPADARVRIIVKGDGTIEFRRTMGLTLLSSHNWATGGVDGASHWVRFTDTGGSSTPNDGSVTLGTWNQLNADRHIGYLQTTLGVRSGSFNIDIATDSSGTNIVCSTGTTKYTMDAEVTL